MPLVPFDANDFSQIWYQNRDADTGAKLGYELAAFQKGHFWNAFEADLVVQCFQIPNNAKIIIIGGGFGWLTGLLLDMNRGFQIACVETSNFILGNQDLNKSKATIQLLNQDFRGTQGKRAIRSALGLSPTNGKADILITEDILTCFSDAEVTQFLPHLRDIAVKVGHIIEIAPNYPPTEESGVDLRLNHKPDLAAWKALVTPDICVRRGWYFDGEGVL
jgi:hypothetical protein